jgi:solute carrier family 13 (sodium-dependent dicarboxylate transporter), member 2/3/5
MTNRIIKDYFGFYLGLIVFFFVLFVIPENAMPPVAQRMAAIALLMAVWWITEAIPIPATALLPIVLFPILEIMKTSDVTVNYGHHLVFLFLGGFIIALTIEKWNLHKRLALQIINIIGTNPKFIILGFMIATAFLSMWISNTATTMMMIPIALAVISQITLEKDVKKFEKGKNNFALALMLGIAYAASIGGIATLIGTPPNLVFIGILKSNFPGAPEISFLQWMIFALPFSILFLPIAWFYLVNIASPVKATGSNVRKEVLQKELKELGPMSQPEKYTLIVFMCTALLWLFRTDFDLGAVKIPGWTSLIGLKGYVHDSTIAIAMAILTFIIPAKTADGEKRKPLQDWSCTAKIPWGILILFGGGFALASGFQASGLTIWLGEQLSAFGFLPLIVIILLVCVITTFTTEFASNTAMATTLLPIVAGLAIALGVNPMLLMIPTTISSSTAFMLPVATPPNAIVFGSGYIQIKDMVRIGIFMNIIGLILIVCLLYLGAGSIFGIDWQTIPIWAK